MSIVHERIKKKYKYPLSGEWFGVKGTKKKKQFLLVH